MGNSLLDVTVFGRRAGREAALKSKEVKIGKLTLHKVTEYKNKLKEEGIEAVRTSPMLLPDYVGKVG
jgi:succinate dehydrogenase / fumarate reductase flavoprotein subunit